MQELLNGVIDNYFWFLLVSIILLFALVGYFVDAKRKKNKQYKISQNNEINLDKIEIKENVALSEMVSKNKNVGFDSSPVNISIESLDDSN